jgi:hypothetical protein
MKSLHARQFHRAHNLAASLRHEQHTTRAVVAQIGFAQPQGACKLPPPLVWNACTTSPCAPLACGKALPYGML